MTDERAPLRKAGDDRLHPSATHARESTIDLRGNTADSVTKPGSEKPVRLEVRIPKSLRKSVRKEAERRGVTVDEVVIDALASRTIH